MRLPVYFFIFIFLFSACRTSFDAKNEAPLNDPIYAVAKLVQSDCFSTSKPSFLAVVSSLQNSVPPFQIEGAWHNHFTTLELKFIGVLGESYGAITLNTDSNNNALPPALLGRNPRFIALFEFIKELKPLGTRQLMCGYNAFFSHQEASALYKNKPIKTFNSMQQVYSSKTNIIYQNHNVRLQNQIFLSNEPNQVSEMEISSSYRYGYFNQELMDTRWQGSFSKKEQVVVKKILFKVKKNDYLIDFVDYI